MKLLKKITSYRLKVLLIYLLITMIPLLVFMGVVQNQYVERLRSQALDSLDNTTDSMVSLLDDCFLQIKNISDGLTLLDETTKNYFPNKPAEANTFRDRLSVHITNSSLFDEIALYATDNEYLFSSQSSYTKERFLQEKHLDYLSIEKIDQIIRESYGPVLLDSDGDIAFCVLYPIHIRDGAKALIFSFPTRKLNARMSTALLNNEGYCQIMTNQSDVLHSYSSNGDIPDQYVVEQSLTGQQSVQSSGIIWYCASKTTTIGNMAVSVLISDGSVHQSVDSIKWSWSALILLSIGLCFAASWLTSFINTKPIVKMSKKISSSILQREKGSDEIEHIDASITHLSDFAATVQREMAELGDYLTFRLLCGTIESVEEANQLSKMLGTSIYADAYQVCIMDIGRDQNVKEVSTIIRSLLPMEVSALTRVCEDVYVCVLFYSLDDQNAIDVFSERFLQCYPNSRIFFGNSYTQLTEIPVSFMEAYIAVENVESTVSSFIYTDMLLQKIEMFRREVDRNDVQRVSILLKQLCVWIEEKQYSLQEIKCLCVQYVHILANSSLGDNLTDALPNMYVLISADSLEILLKAIDPLAKVVDSLRATNTENHQSTSLVDQMVMYLTANYRNPNFSVQQMAFDFHLTPSALSRYFKEHYGRNINDYLNLLKMERAKQLLLETNLPIYEIGLELGYQGPNSFIRRFKATYGITPGEFRQEN